MNRNHLNLVINPVDEICNLSCIYCNSAKYSPRKPKMSLETLKRIFETTGKSDFKSFRFTWHGGEPLVLGIDFFKCVIRFQNEYFGAIKSHRYDNVIQTNGLLMTNEMLDFFYLNNFNLGFSIDGPDVESNFYRFGHEKKPSLILEKTIEVFKNVKSRQKHLYVIMVIHDKNVHRAQDIYNFLKENKVDTVSFNPKFNKGVESSNISPSQYSEFLKNFQEINISDNTYNLFAANIQKIINYTKGIATNQCYIENACNQFIAINSQGDVFATCADDLGYKIGSVHENFQNLINSSPFPKDSILDSEGKSVFLSFGCPKYTKLNSYNDEYLLKAVEKLSSL